ncbi:hypothetical protein [Leptothrix ochracea]|uniref:hypothetical protein n=1 Tax=Leptothrix ochracea TaxID=735331 RepID=UPI0034E22038
MLKTARVLSPLIGLAALVLPCWSFGQATGEWHSVLGLGLVQNKPLHGTGDTAIYRSEFFHIYTGARYQQGADAAVQITVGYQKASTGDAQSQTQITFRRVPMEVLSSMKVAPQLWLGWGLRYAPFAEIYGATTAARSFSPGTGLILEAEIPHVDQANEHIAYCLRYVRESYKEHTGEPINGSHIGVFMRFGGW